MYSDLAVFSGRAHPALAKAIGDRVGRPLGNVDIFEFSNENIFVQFQENIRQLDVYLIQPFVTPVSTAIMELLIMIDAARRASAGRITAVIPYYGYGRSDKKDQPRVPITARLVANMLETAGADRILTMDLHAGQIQGFFNVPVDELTALYVLGRYFRERGDMSNTTVLSPDVGGAKRARNMARQLGAPLAVVDKERTGNDESASATGLIGDVRGRHVIISDEEILTGGTIVAAVNIAIANGAKTVTAACTHAVLSGEAVERICGLPIDELVVTDTVPLPPQKQHPKVRVLSVAPLFGDAIGRIHSGQSVGALFQ